MAGRSFGVRIPLREQPELARRVFALHERGWSVTALQSIFRLGRSDVVNLLGLGRRLAAGQGVPLQWR